MTKPLYSIRNLRCQYRGAKLPVLEIEALDIQPGSIVFLVGSSGVGKSTALEVMGLMNNTLAAKPESKFEFCHAGGKENLLTIWDGPGNRLSEFRRRHLSFVFQTTNLMPTLSALQNVMVTSTLHGASSDSARGRAKAILAEILQKKKIDARTKVTELSGGEKQRLAFARAISTDFTVLFADEPTGNLDWGNAILLMDFLTNHIRKQGKTAIIVSHDVRLATTYGDMIVYIEGRRGIVEDELYRYGAICEALTFHREVSETGGLPRPDTGGWLKGSQKRVTSEELIHDLQLRLIREARDYE
jgi:ABC-type lipoprotein export system ATPase subunit